jgi:heptosyltransferase-1
MSAVLVIRPSSLGDIVHALALVCDVRTARPGLAVDWIAEESFVPLVALDRGVRRVIPVALRRWRHAPLAAATWREFTAFRQQLRRDEYAAVLDLQEQVKGALLARMARGVRHGPDRHSIREPIATLAHDVHHRIDPHQHLVDRCRQLAAAALGYVCAGRPRFDFALPPVPAANCRGPFVVAVHATSATRKAERANWWR